MKKLINDSTEDGGDGLTSPPAKPWGRLLQLWLCCRAKWGIAVGRIWWKMGRGRETEVKASEQLLAGLRTGGEEGRQGKSSGLWHLRLLLRRNGGSYVTLYQCGWASDELFYRSVPELHTRPFFSPPPSWCVSFSPPEGPCWTADVFINS